MKFFNQTFGASPVFFVFLLLVFQSCSENEPAINDSKAPEEINDYMVSLPSWEEFCPPKEDITEVFDLTKTFSCQTKVAQTSAPCSITRTPEEIVTCDPGIEILYVGSLIQGKGYLEGLGSMKSLPIYQRAPLTISISFQMSGNSREITNPDLNTVNDAIGELVETAENAGHAAASSILFEKKTSYSLDQTALALNLSARYWKASAKASLDWEKTGETSTVSAYFLQKMFTVSMKNPQLPGDIFSDEFTKEILDEQVARGRIGPDNLPVYVSNIVYGRMMMFTMTSTYDEETMSAALEASYKAFGVGGSVNISAEDLEVFKKSSIQFVTIGGSEEAALAYLQSGNLGEFFKKDAPLTSAVPISYTLRNLGDNNVARVSETVSYNMIQNDSVKVQYFNTESEWRNAVQSQHKMSLKEWQTNESNIKKADESNSFEVDGSQIWLGKRITLDGSITGFPFSFYLENTAVDANADGVKYALTFRDQEVNWGETISIGDFANWANDDFEIGITNGDVYAIAFTMIDNDNFTGEYMEVHAMDAKDECQIALFNSTDIGGFKNGFIGIISPVPIKRVHFNEDNTTDDIGIKDLRFGCME